MLNEFPTGGTLRQPRGVVLVNGANMPGWVEVEVESNVFYAADTFRVTFVLSLLPAERDANWWSEQTSVTVEVFAGVPADPVRYDQGQLQSLIVGDGDEIHMDMVAGILTVSGRDYTRAFIDAKTSEKYTNKLPHEIAQVLAASHGLTADVDPVSEKAGRYYEIDHVQLSDERSEWDLLTWLAAQTQRRVWVRGKTLFFKKAPDESADRYVIRWEPPTFDRGYSQANVQQLSFARNLTVAKGVAVVVRSWNARQKQGFTEVYPKNAKGTKAGDSAPKAQIYSYTIAGLTQEQALQRAQALHKQITQHELRLSASLPADEILDVTQQIEVQGTGTAFDTTYYPDSIRRTLSVSGGYVMTVSAKNQSPESTPSL